jgi:hypothetical protein
LLTVARHEDSRRCLLLLNLILETPELLDRLWNVLRPEALAFGDEREQAKGDSQ